MKSSAWAEQRQSGMDLRTARERAAFTIAELAALAALHPASLWKIEVGRCHPRAQTRRRLAEALHVLPADIEWPKGQGGRGQ